MNPSIPDIAGDADLARRLAAMSHPARLEILKHLARQDCCCKDVVGGLSLAQSTVSQHLKVLVSAGLVNLSSHQQRSIYRIDRDMMMATAKAMAGLVESCCAPVMCGGSDTEIRSRNGS